MESCNFPTTVGVFMATPPLTMKTNIYLGFIFISGITAYALDAGLIAMFAVIPTAGVIGMACNDYAPSRTITFGLTV